MNLLLQTCSDSGIVPQECLSFFKFSTNLSLPSQTDHWCAQWCSQWCETQRGWSSSALRPKTEIPLLAAGWQRKWRWNLKSCTTPESHVHCSQIAFPRWLKPRKKQNMSVADFNHWCCDSFVLCVTNAHVGKGVPAGLKLLTTNKANTATDVEPKTKLLRLRTAACKQPSGAETPPHQHTYGSPRCGCALYQIPFSYLQNINTE